MLNQFMLKLFGKQVFLFLLVAASAILFGGCSSPEFDASKPASTAPPAPGDPPKPRSTEEALNPDFATKPK